MKNHVFLWTAAAVLAGGAFFCGSAAGVIEVLEEGYVLETYVVFETVNERPPGDMVFDPAGNLYLVHTETTTGRDGSIYRIDPDKNVVRWITGLTRPLDIIWSDSAEYGEYLYICECSSNGQITRIDLDGVKSKFSQGIIDYPVTLNLDRSGNYNGYMYVGNGVRDKTVVVKTNGQSETFSGFPYLDNGSPAGIEFDIRGNYGGLMYVVVASGDSANLWRGLFTLDTSGNPTRVAPDLTRTGDLEFDTTSGQGFGGYLYVLGKTEADAH
jgi:hypothetical protein